MNNLKPIKIRCLPIDDIKGEIIYVSVGEELKNKEVYYLHQGSLICVDLVERKKLILGTEINDVIIGEYMCTQAKITVSTLKSTIIVDCESKKFYKHEYNKEVLQIGWNNTYDYLAVIFKDGTISTFVFDVRFELIRQGAGTIYAMVSLIQDIGWGSHITQFQGPKLTSEIQSTECHVSPVDDQKPRICWRGNNDEFVVSYVEEDVRLFKVFDHSCLPKACSRIFKGKMYGPIAWKPRGSIIAAAIFQSERNYIGLFERNGLFRMLFPLIDLFYPITFLSWSPCGKVLNVTQEDQKNQTHICLYVTSNTRWFMKQHLIFTVVNSLCTLTWAMSSPYYVELIAVSKKEIINFKYKFEFDYDRRHNLIAAIDGKTIRVHVLKEAIDPPPSCTDVIVMDNPINIIAFHPTRDLAAALDSSNNLYCFSIEDAKLNLITQMFLLKPVFPLNINHLFFRGNNPQVIVENIEECSSVIHEFNMKSKQFIQRKVFDVTLYAIEHIHMINDIMITHDKKYRTIHKDGENSQTSHNLPYPLQIIPLQFGSDIFCLILTQDDEFYVEKQLIHRGITSMIVHNGYLILTDDCSLYTMRISQYSIETLSCDRLSEFHKRPLNETAHIVCMIADTPNILLITPRGNLEIISCRSMEVKIIEEKLSIFDWSGAVKFMRLSKLNWNLLLDLDSERFYKNLDQVVEICSSHRVLDAIVGDISDKNCLSTIYSKTTTTIPYTPLNKRRDFLTKLGEYLDQSGSFADYLPTVMKICVDQNNIEKAMHYTLFLLNCQEKELKKKAELAITLLKINIATEDLFKAALETFDLQLADLVAMKCQMNPQEVDPILNELSKMNNLEKRLSICLRYQNWEEAITYMLRKENVNKEEILTFIQEHDVSKRAHLEMLKLKIPFKKEIAELYAQKLISLKYHNEAAVILVQYLLYDEAVNQFKLALNYKKCIEYLPLSSLTEEKKSAVFKDLAEKLIVMDKISEAALIYEDHLEDHMMAIKTLTDGRKFVDALALVRKYDFHDLIDLNILPEMINVVETIMNQVEENTYKFKIYFERLMKLRNCKKYNFEIMKKRNQENEDSAAASIDSFGSNHLKALEKERVAEFDAYFQLDVDLQSVLSAGSRTSSKSTTSTITQKQVRKMEKKTQDITERSRFEDIALMREMHIMISSIFKFGPEIRELFLCLIEYSAMDMHALKLYHSKLYNLQVLMKDEVQMIWDEEFSADSKATYISENFLFMDEQFRTIPLEVEYPGLSWLLETLI